MIIDIGDTVGGMPGGLLPGTVTVDQIRKGGLRFTTNLLLAINARRKLQGNLPLLLPADLIEHANNDVLPENMMRLRLVMRYGFAFLDKPRHKGSSDAMAQLTNSIRAARKDRR